MLLATSYSWGYIIVGFIGIIGWLLFHWKGER